MSFGSHAWVMCVRWAYRSSYITLVYMPYHIKILVWNSFVYRPQVWILNMPPFFCIPMIEPCVFHSNIVLLLISMIRFISLHSPSLADQGDVSQKSYEIFQTFFARSAFKNTSTIHCFTQINWISTSLVTKLLLIDSEMHLSVLHPRMETSSQGKCTLPRYAKILKTPLQ